MKQRTLDLLHKIDLEAVNKAIRSIPLIEFEYDQVTESIVRVCDAYLATDLEDNEQCLVEVKGVHDGFSFVFDLVFVTRQGDSKITDWKYGKDSRIARSEFDTETKWTDQSSIYLTTGKEWLKKEYGIEPKVLTYRAVGYGTEKRLKLVTCRDDEIVACDCESQRDGILSLYGALERVGVWPRNRPSACLGYDYECAYFSDCKSMTMPVGFEAEAYQGAIPRSKSAFSKFLECPEKYRRTNVLESQGRDTEKTFMSLGLSFHAGVASVWKQSFEARGAK